MERHCAERFHGRLKVLMDAAYNKEESIGRLVEALVPTYHPRNAGEKDTTFAELSRQTAAVV